MEAENVEQNMEDIFNGVKSLVEDPKDILDRAITSWEQLGFEAPKVDCVFLAKPTISVVLYSQMIRRGLRGPAIGGKNHAL